MRWIVLDWGLAQGSWNKKVGGWGMKRGVFAEGRKGPAQDRRDVLNSLSLTISRGAPTVCKTLCSGPG